MSLARTYPSIVLTYRSLNGPVFPYPKEVKERGITCLVARDETGHYFKITYPGNRDGIWIPKCDFGKDFTLYPVSFKKKSEFVYPNEVKEGLSFLIGKTKNGYFKVVFKPSPVTLIHTWVPEADFMKDFKKTRVSDSCMEHLMTASGTSSPVALLAAIMGSAPVAVAAPAVAVAAPAPVAAPAAPAAPVRLVHGRKLSRGRPRKAMNPELSKRNQSLLSEEVDADRLFASAAQTYKRIKLANKELVAEVQRLKSRVEELERK